MRRALASDGTGAYDVEYRTVGLEDGIERWIAAAGTVFFKDRAPIRFVGTVLDISAQKSAEARLRASEGQFRLMAQAVPNHVWTASPDGQLDWFNDQVYAYSGARSAPWTAQAGQPSSIPTIWPRQANAGPMR